MLEALVISGSLLVSFLLGFPVYRILRSQGIVAYPNERSSHSEATVCGGGVGLMVVIGSVVLALAIRGDDALPLWVLFGVLVTVAALSWMDDIKEISSAIRLLFHSLAATVLLWIFDVSGFVFEIGPEFVWNLPPVLVYPIFFLWIAGYTNAFNFMDGINGISGIQAGVTGIAMGFISGTVAGDWSHPAIMLSLAAGGASLGFLPHNFPKARMFMGDVGSAPLGCLLAVLVVWMASEFGWWLLVPLALLHANYVLDTAITLLRRIIRGDSWHSAHREHFYQRLVRAGHSHSFVSSIQAGLQLVAATVIVLLYLGAGTGTRIFIIGSVFAMWLIVFGYAEVRFRRTIIDECAVS